MIASAAPLSHPLLSSRRTNLDVENGTRAVVMGNGGGGGRLGVRVAREVVSSSCASSADRLNEGAAGGGAFESGAASGRSRAAKRRESRALELWTERVGGGEGSGSAGCVVIQRWAVTVTASLRRAVLVAAGVRTCRLIAGEADGTKRRRGDLVLLVLIPPSS